MQWQACCDLVETEFFPYVLQDVAHNIVNMDPAVNAKMLKMMARTRALTEYSCVLRSNKAHSGRHTYTWKRDIRIYMYVFSNCELRNNIYINKGTRHRMHKGTSAFS